MERRKGKSAWEVGSALYRGVYWQWIRGKSSFRRDGVNGENEVCERDSTELEGDEHRYRLAMHERMR